MKKNKKAILGFAFSMLVSLSFMQGFEISGKNAQTNQISGAIGGYISNGEASGAWMGAAGGLTAAGGAMLLNPAGTAVTAATCPWCLVGGTALLM